MNRKYKPNSIILVFSHFAFFTLCILCLIPFLLISSSSLSSEESIISKGYSLLPRNFSFLAYTFVLNNSKQLINSYTISISVAVIGTILGLLVNSMIAYPISRIDFKLRKKISFYTFFPILFSGGLVPWYIVITSLKMQNTFWVLIIPMLAAPWNVLLLRTFFQSIHPALIESAKIDGSNEFRIFFTIILPLSKPALATVGLFIAFGYWNDYLMGLLFITKDNLVSLQYMFYRINANIEFFTKMAGNLPAGISRDTIPKQTSGMALCVLTAGPMLIVFPFFQKYFVKGLVVGSVKG